jgi:hypothetical protein
MADRVVVAGVHRANVRVESMTVRQMCGRAGRPKIRDGRPVLSRGDAYVLLPESGFSALKDEYGAVEPVTSRLNDARHLAFHAVSEIVQGRVVDAASFADWHSRSLAHAQGLVLERADIERAFADLSRLRAVETSDDGETFVATPLGKLSYHMYFSPWQVCGWCINFSKLFKLRTAIDDVTAPWAIANVSEYAAAGAGGSAADVAAFRGACAKRGLQLEKPPAVVGAAIAGLMRGRRLPGLEGLQAQLAADMGRVATALSLMEKMCAPWWKYGKWAELGAMVRYGLPPAMAALTRLDGVGGKRARILWSYGIHKPSELASRTETHDRLRKQFGPCAFDVMLSSSIKSLTGKRKKVGKTDEGG